MKSEKTNSFYSNIVVNDSWINVSEQSDPMLWDLLTNDGIDKSNDKYGTDFDEEIEATNNAKQSEQCVTNANLTGIYDLDRPHIDRSQIVNISPAEDQMSLSHTNEPDCTSLSK